MKSDNPIVYTCFCTDIIHDGHLNLINEAKNMEMLLSEFFATLKWSNIIDFP